MSSDCCMLTVAYSNTFMHMQYKCTHTFCKESLRWRYVAHWKNSCAECMVLWAPSSDGRRQRAEHGCSVVRCTVKPGSEIAAVRLEMASGLYCIPCTERWPQWCPLVLKSPVLSLGKKIKIVCVCTYVQIETRECPLHSHHNF